MTSSKTANKSIRAYSEKRVRYEQRIIAPKRVEKVTVLSRYRKDAEFSEKITTLNVDSDLFLFIAIINYRFGKNAD